MTRNEASSTERAIPPVPGTRDLSPDDQERLDAIEALLLDRFARAGYRRIGTPILEPVELHERKSGARIVSSLFAIQGGLQDTLCLRPELTAGIVRSYTALDPPPPLPWRVSYAGPVFRNQEVSGGLTREFRQVGVELMGASRPSADGEVIWLAEWSAREAGLDDLSIRIGHVGLIREVLRRSELPEPVQVTLVETLSEAASRGEEATSPDRVVAALEQHLRTLSGWLRADEAAEMRVPGDGPASDPGVDRLFRTLHPSVMGRRTAGEVIGRLRRKWDLGHTLRGAVAQLGDRLHELADLRGLAGPVLDRLRRDFRDAAPESVTAIEGLVATLQDHGIDLGRVELDLGFGRGLGFYSQMMFVLVARAGGEAIEICGGGRYDGLARDLGGDRDDRGVGFAFGLERIDAARRARGGAVPKVSPPSGVLLIPASPDALSATVRQAVSLRASGVRAVVDADRRGADALSFARSSGLAGVATVGNVTTYQGVRDREPVPVPEGALRDQIRGAAPERAS